MPTWGWVALGVVALALVGGGAAVAVNRSLRAKLLASPTAKELGIDNSPPARLAARLDWLSVRADEILKILHRVDGTAAIGSGYRSDTLNAAVDGSPSSRHREGLAFDITSGTKTFEQYQRLARAIREGAEALTEQPEDVLVERVPLHLHIEWREPGKRGKTSYRQEIAGRTKGKQRRFEALA